MKILVINPGSTSTKLAVYNDIEKIWSNNIYHSAEELSLYRSINEQYDFRKELILNILKENDIELKFSAVIGRGGLLRPTCGGIYEITEKILYDLRNAKMEHASNLGAPIAYEIAKFSGSECKSYIADPAVTDELCDIARISGLPELPRISVFHALNSRAVCRQYASKIGRMYENMNLIVVHMGGGISVSAHSFGKVIDVNNALNGDGPFSPERAGTLPAAQLVDLCFSGKYSQNEIHRMINGHGGVYAHLGTTDVKSVIEKVEAGDKECKLIIDAMIYNISKSVGSMHVTLKQRTDAVILTGGIAYNQYVIAEICEWISGLAPVVVIPGEDEMYALAMNALGVLKGELQLHTYNPL